MSAHKHIKSRWISGDAEASPRGLVGGRRVWRLVDNSRRTPISESAAEFLFAENPRNIFSASRIRRRIFLRRKSAEKIRCTILSWAVLRLSTVLVC